MTSIKASGLPRRGKLDRVNDFLVSFPRRVFLAEKLACTGFERGSLPSFHAENRVNGKARKTRENSAKKPRLNEALVLDFNPFQAG